jgi:uncharacterized DUF497 family protein
MVCSASSREALKGIPSSDWFRLGQEEGRGEREEARSRIRRSRIRLLQSLSLTIEDPAHSVGENRLVTMGLSALGRVIVVVHVDWGEETRIISARYATPREKRQYHG